MDSVGRSRLRRSSAARVTCVAPEIQVEQVLHRLQMIEPRIRDVRAVEPELAQLGQAAQVLQARIADRRIGESQVFQVRELGEIRQAGVGDLTPSRLSLRRLMRFRM